MKPLRRLRRVLPFCVLAFCLFVLLSAGGLWLAHRHLTKLTVQAINRSFPELELSARTVGLSTAGIVDLKSIRLRVRSDGSTAVSIPSAQVRFSWNELRQQLVREVIIDQPSVRIGDSFLSALGLQPTESGTASEPSAPWRIGKLTITNGEARVELNGQPAISAGFSLDMAEGGIASTNQVHLTDLRVRHGNAREEVLALSSVKVSASPEDLRRGRLRDLAIDGLRLRLTDQALAMLPKKSADSGTTPTWECDRLSLSDGFVQIDRAGWPTIDFGVAVRAEHLASEGGGAFELSLAGLNVQLRGEKVRALTVAGIRVAGTANGVARGVLQQLEVDQPIVNVSDSLLVWRPPASASAPDSSAEAFVLPPSAKIERLVVKGGQATVDLQGAPLANFHFGARLQNAGLGADSAEEVQSLEVLDFALKPRLEGVESFLRIPAIRAEVRLPELIEKRRLARLRIEHLDFRYNTAFREMIASGAKPAPTRASETPVANPSSVKGPTPTIGELRLVDGRLHLDDLGVGIPGIECRLETAFRELAMEPGGGAGGQELQTIELSQIALRSPLDPFVTVLDLDTVFVRFTLAGLWARNIDEVAIVRPTLAIGPDLFWYIDRVQKNQDAPAEAPAPVDDGPPWTIDRFSAKSGQLLLALEGQAKLALPMPFESRAHDLNFRRLSDLRLKLQIDMPEQDYDYPGYELALRGVSGRVEFSLPPQKRKNNVVNTLRMKAVRWKNFHGRDLFLDVTYDELGVYGNLTGRGYSGILRGQFNFLLTPESDWNAWVAGTAIDLKPITAALAPEKFSLSSPADFRLSVKARASEILKVDGDFKATRGGDMRIGKLDEFIRDLPGDWSGVKKGLSRISLETLRDFSYDTAHGAFHFIGLVGAVHLDLQGPNGSRKIEMNFREADPSTPKSRVATTQP